MQAYSGIPEGTCENIEVEHMGVTYTAVIDYEEEHPGQPFVDDEGMPHLLTWHKRYTFSSDKPEDFGMFANEYTDAWFTYDERLDEDRELSTVEDIADHLRREYGAEILPVYLFDHSGVSVRCDPSGFSAFDSAGWDWGLLGFVFMTRDEIAYELSQYHRKGRKPYESRTVRAEYRGATVLQSEWLVEDQWVSKFPAHTYRVTAQDREIARERMAGAIEYLDLILTGQVFCITIYDDEGRDVESLGWMVGYEGVETEARSMAESCIEIAASEKEARRAKVVAIEDYMRERESR
jgi:hypothetical protein